ncbi:hypothetical protein IJG72_04890 [bacterium]|nr:hypothetical protein [bacterium]
MKKFLLLLLAIITFINFKPVFAICESQLDETLYNKKEIKSQILKIRNRKIIISNALLLSDSQKTNLYNLFNQDNQKEAILYLKLKEETNLLNNLNNNKNISRIEKRNQKKTISKIKKEIELIEKNNEADFKQILTRKQRAKYNKLKREIPLN